MKAAARIHRALMLAGSLSLATALSCASAAPTAAPAAPAEIMHLLDYLGASGCRFLRAGTWHDAKAARAHLATKYEYLRKRNMVDTADQFIDRVASASSVTGAAYDVRCGAAAAMPSADWLRAELRRLRAGSAAPADRKH